MCIWCLLKSFWVTFVKQTFVYLEILPVKIQGVLFLKMDLWRTEKASVRYLVCIWCLFKLFWATFVKQIFVYFEILLVKIQGILLLKMDLWRTLETSVTLCNDDSYSTWYFDELLYWNWPSVLDLRWKMDKILISGTYPSSKDPEGQKWFWPQNFKIYIEFDWLMVLKPIFGLPEPKNMALDLVENLIFRR